MNSLIWVISTIWAAVSTFFTWLKTIIPTLFNKIWLSALIMVGIIYSMMKYAAGALGIIADKLDGMSLGSVTGHAPSGGSAATILTIRGWLEVANAVFPINEGFTMLIGYLALLAALLVIGFIWKLISSVF